MRKATIYKMWPDIFVELVLYLCFYNFIEIQQNVYALFSSPGCHGNHLPSCAGVTVPP